MNILFTTEIGSTKQTYFPAPLLARLEKLGLVIYNQNVGHPFSEGQLIEAIPDIDICLTHWGCPQFSDRVLERANRLALVAGHAADSVADLVTPNVYQRGIRAA